MNVRVQIPPVPPRQSNMGDKKILCIGLVCLDIINVLDKYPEEDTDNRLVCEKVNEIRKNNYFPLRCLIVRPQCIG